MRRQLLLLTAGLAMASMASVQAADNGLPERLYLVGGFNGWATPDNNDDRDAWSLVDEDGDGVYTGSFELPEGSIAFKICDAPVFWTDYNHFFGTYSNAPTAIYSDVEWSQLLGRGMDYGDISILNWAGGTLTLQAKYTLEGEYGSIVLFGSGSNQPVAPAMAKEMWVIGDFNDWKLPEGDNANGALSFPMTTYGVYLGGVTFPKGTHSFAVCYQDPESKEWTKYYTNKFSAAPFTLCRIEEALPAMYPLTLLESDNEYANVPTLRDWNGTDIIFNVNYNETSYKSLFLSSESADVVNVPATFYTLYSINGGDWQSVLYPGDGYEDVMGNDIRLLFSEKPASEGVDFASAYGVMDGWNNEMDVTADIDNFFSSGVLMPLQKGGKPILLKSTNKEFKLNFAAVRWDAMQADITVVKKPEPPTDLYLIGSIQGWNVTNGDMKFEKLNEGVFFGKFPVNDPGDVMFRIYSQLGNWDEGSYGSFEYDGDNLDITIPYGGWIVSGKGNWNVTNFTGEYIYVTVDINLMTISVANESGVQLVGNESSKTVEGIYDLNGLRHDTLRPGINIIRYTDGTAAKVLE